MRRLPAELWCGGARVRLLRVWFRLGIARLVERVQRWWIGRQDRPAVGFSAPSRERLLGCTVSQGATGEIGVASSTRRTVDSTRVASTGHGPS